jgi:hypothetical protein
VLVETPAGKSIEQLYFRKSPFCHPAGELDLPNCPASPHRCTLSSLLRLVAAQPQSLLNNPIKSKRITAPMTALMISATIPPTRTNPTRGNAAAKTRRLKGENQLPKVVQGVKFQNGIEVIKMPAHHAA